MKRWIILAVAVVAISSLATAVVQLMPLDASTDDVVKFPAVRYDGPQPKAVVEGNTTYNFGTLPQRETRSKVWVVRNEGKGPLKLWMISSTCSCTIAKFKDGKADEVKPGDKTEITLEFETRENNGTYSKGATIGTNDPKLPQFVLSAEGIVRPAVQVFPDTTVNYNMISDDEKDHVQSIAVFSADRPDMKITKISSSKPDLISGEAEPLTKLDCEQLQCKKGFKVKLNVKSGLPLGLFREEVVVETDHPKQPRVQLTVTGKMVGPIAVTPDVVRMHNVTGSDGDTTSVTLTVRSRKKTTFEVAQKPKALEVAITPTKGVEKSGVYRMTITVPPGTAAADIEDWIVLKTDNPDASELKIPISVYIQGKAG